MVSRRMLDDGKTKTGAAGSLGVAFVHAIEAFIDSAVMFHRNANAGIADRQTVGFLSVGNVAELPVKPFAQRKTGLLRLPLRLNG